MNMNNSQSNSNSHLESKLVLIKNNSILILKHIKMLMDILNIPSINIKENQSL